MSAAGKWVGNELKDAQGGVEACWYLTYTLSMYILLSSFFSLGWRSISFAETRKFYGYLIIL